MKFTLKAIQSVTAIALAVLATAPAQAASNTPTKDKDYITGYVGYFDVTQQDDSAAQFGVEYRARALQFAVRPVFGVNVTNEGAVYGYAGINWDAELIKDQLYLIPNFAAGLYHKGDGKDLGGAIEFRSGVELAYQFENSHRLGIAFNHVSNASIYNRNPGAETALITYSVPTDMWR